MLSDYVLVIHIYLKLFLIINNYTNNYRILLFIDKAFLLHSQRASF